jgi:endoglucanase
MTSSFLLGVSLAGAESGLFPVNVPGVYGIDYTYPTHAEIDYYASKGLGVIRLPFLWERMQHTEFGALDPTELGRLTDVVNYATSRGLKVVIDPHDFGYGFGGLIGSVQTPNSAFTDFWAKLAQQFQSNTNVIFGLMNEPHDQSATAWLESANAAIAAIRNAGAVSQEILVPGSYWDGALTWTITDNAAVMGTGIQDPAHNFAFEVHQYFTIPDYPLGTQPSAVSPTTGVEQVTAITQWAEATGNRLFLGEFGVTTDQTSLTALDAMLTYMQQHTDAWQGATYWAGGPWSGNDMFTRPFSIEPQNGVDKPQMAILVEHLAVSEPNQPPPVGTSADMILRRGDGTYGIYNIGNNRILGNYQLGQVGTDWQFVGLGGFYGGDTTDMLLRNATTGGFEIYDISNNNITNAASLGTVGLDWQFGGFGDFSSMPGETDMILRNVNTGGVEVYDISNNQITGAAFMGTVGLDWQFSGIGDFSGRGTSDMLLRNSNTGGLEVYDINNNQITGAAFIGTVGVDWQFSGVGNFSGVPGETDLLLRNSKTGGLEVYDINNSQITGAAFVGTVGLDWQFAGIAPVQGSGTSNLLLRNVNTGAFEVYNIANNQITGAAPLGSVGLNWELGGFAVDPLTASMGDSSQVSQLVQAMAGFGGSSGATESLSTAALGADASQQTLLTTPQHA